MPILVTCKCGKKFRADEKHEGKQKACPKCGLSIEIAGPRVSAYDVFVSYSSKDKATCDALVATFERKGVRCWIAPRDILPGVNWGEAIIGGIEQSRVMVLVFSAHSNESPQVKREVERAVSKGTPVIPLRIEDVKLSRAMEYFISSQHWLDALTPPLEVHLEELARKVIRLLTDDGSANTQPTQRSADVIPTALPVDDWSPPARDIFARAPASTDPLWPTSPTTNEPSPPRPNYLRPRSSSGITWTRFPLTWRWIAIGSAAAFLVLVAFLMFRPARAPDTRISEPNSTDQLSVNIPPIEKQGAESKMADVDSVRQVPANASSSQPEMEDNWIWSDPVHIGRNVDTPGDFESGMAVNPKELTVFFARRSSQTKNRDLWKSNRASRDAPFGPAERLPGDINSESDEGSPALTSDGLTLFFDSTRPGGVGGWDIYESHRPSLNEPASPARNLGQPINTSTKDSGPTITGDGLVLLFQSDRPGGRGQVSIWMSTRASESEPFTNPVVLGSNINAGGRDFDPGISNDGLVLVFVSDRPGGVGGDDLWMSTRTSREAAFGPAMNLGPKINTSADEFKPSLSMDSGTLYFGSQRGGEGELWFAKRWNPSTENMRDVAADIKPPAPAKEETLASDLEAMQGVWNSVAEEFKGVATPAADIQQMRKTLTISQDRWIVERSYPDGSRSKLEGTIRLTPETNPKQFDWSGTTTFDNKPAKWIGLYELSGDKLRIVYEWQDENSSRSRPTKFASLDGTSITVITFERAASNAESEAGPGVIATWFEKGEGPAIHSMVFSPDGRHCLIGQTDDSKLEKNYSLSYWDVSTGRPIDTARDLSGPVTSLSISPGGFCAVSVSGKNPPVVWNLKNLEGLTKVITYDGPGSAWQAATFAPPNGTQALVGCEETPYLVFWDTLTGQTKPWDGHNASVLSTAFSGDGTRAISGDSNGEVIVWNASTGEKLIEFAKLEGPVTCVRLSRDGLFAYTGNYRKEPQGGPWQIRVWSLQGAQPQLMKAMPGTFFEISADGTRVLGNGEGNAPHSPTMLMDFKQRQWCEAFYPCESPRYDCTVRTMSPDGKLALIAGRDRRLLLWRLPEQ